MVTFFFPLAQQLREALQSERLGFLLKMLLATTFCSAKLACIAVGANLRPPFARQVPLVIWKKPLAVKGPEIAV
jgi:hypothetical protein